MSLKNRFAGNLKKVAFDANESRYEKEKHDHEQSQLAEYTHQKEEAYRNAIHELPFSVSPKIVGKQGDLYVFEASGSVDGAKFTSKLLVDSKGLIKNFDQAPDFAGDGVSVKIYSGSEPQTHDYPGHDNYDDVEVEDKDLVEFTKDMIDNWFGDNDTKVKADIASYEKSSTRESGFSGRLKSKMLEKLSKNK